MCVCVCVCVCIYIYIHIHHLRDGLLYNLYNYIKLCLILSLCIYKFYNVMTCIAFLRKYK